MSGVSYEVRVNGDVYTPAQIEAMRFEREKHVLQELVHYGVPVQKDGKALGFDEVNYLTHEEAPRVLLQAKQAMDAEATLATFREALDASDAFWRDAVARWNPEDGYREAFAEVSVRGMEFAEYMGVLKALMSKGEDAALGEEPEHFCAPELEGLAPNEKASIETMGMFGGPVASVVRVDPTLEVPVQETDGFKNMIVGTSRLLDGTERHDAAIHQFRPVEGGFDLRLYVEFPCTVPQEMADGHSVHLALEFLGGLESALRFREGQASARYLDRPEDLAALGMAPDHVEVHEDGRQSVKGRPGSEVWYFDAVLDGGSKFVGGFRNKSVAKADQDDDEPLMVVTVTEADGTEHSDTMEYPDDACSIALDSCDFRCGPHFVEGDLVDYHIHIEPVEHAEGDAAGIDGLAVSAGKGLGVDLHFHANVRPYRHGAGRAVFGGDPAKFSSWLCIPNMEVSGTVIVDGVAREVHGTGYHDHRCMAVNDLEAWHHWLWGRQVFDNYTAVIYDYVTSKKYGFVELPLFAVYDKDGNVIYDNGADGTMRREILEMAHDPQSRRDYPKRSRYTFTANDGRVFTYELDGEEIIEVRDLYWTVPKKQREMFDMLGLQVCYNRYYARGRLTVADTSGVQASEEGRLIYEFAYVGKDDPADHLH